VRTWLAVATLAILSTLCQASAATAGIGPYVRLGFGPDQLRMAEINAGIMSDQDALRAGGYPANFQKIRIAAGPEAAVGLWLLPGFRVGAVYGAERSTRDNLLNVPGQLFFDHRFEFRVTEIGGEAAIRIVRLAGLSIGGQVVRSRATGSEALSVDQPGSLFHYDATAERTLTTYGAFIGLDQTNEIGIAGYVRAGYRFRDMGHMPSRGTVSDGTNTTSFTGSSIDVDYSGFYVMAGAGFDLRH
jgi:hypothetical protein